MRFMILAVVLTLTTGKPLDEPNDLSAPASDVPTEGYVTDSTISSQSDKLSEVTETNLAFIQQTTKSLPEVTQVNNLPTANNSITHGITTVESDISLSSSLPLQNEDEYDVTKTWQTTEKDVDYEMTTLTPQILKEITDLPNEDTTEKQNIDRIYGETTVIEPLNEPPKNINENSSESEQPFTSATLVTEDSTEFTTPDALSTKDSSETFLPVEIKYDTVSMLVPLLKSRNEIPVTSEDLKSTTLYPIDTSSSVSFPLNSEAPVVAQRLSEIEEYPKISETEKKSDIKNKTETLATNQQRSAKSLESSDILELMKNTPNDEKVTTEEEIIWVTDRSSTIKPVTEPFLIKDHILPPQKNLDVNSKNFTRDPNQMEKDTVILAVLETPKILEQFKESAVPTNSTGSGRVTRLLSYTLYERSQEKTVLKHFIDYLRSLRK